MTPDAATGLVVLLGDPVGHSLSPALHNAAFEAQGLNLTYLACRVSATDLGAAVEGLGALGAVGANVTIPHKRAVLGLAQSASAAARATGAANTLVRADGGWHADNTDVEGFLAPLGDRERFRDETAVVLGAGGAARAVAWACAARLGSRVVVAARRRAQAAALADALGSGVEARSLEELGDAGREAALVVNATPVGMAPHADATPWAFGPGVRRDQIVYDLVYRPSPTRFLREADALGLETIGGLPMLIGQAAASYRLWTGREMPLGPVRSALDSTPP